MPRLIDTPETDAIALGDLVEMLESGDFDARDEDNFASWGGALKRLANNRSFLGDLVIDELKQRCRGQIRDNQYSSQVILLHSVASKFLIRANFWPGEQDSVVVNSGTNPFFYGVPHDHNFSFLTVGYAGPGYWSEYYEYDYEDVAGYPGEPVDLRFVEKSKLDEGKVMLYRAHRDVHNQLPADAMSVSLNILEKDYATSMRDQYRFDLASKTIDGVLTLTSLEPLLALSAHIGGEAGRELVAAFAARHPSDRIRFKALQAEVGVLLDIDLRIERYARAARGDNPLVAQMASRAAQALERSRHWIEGSKAPAMQVPE